MSAIQESANVSGTLENTATQNIQKILVPVDFSATSKVALDYAVAIAKGLGSQVVVYHSVTPMADISLAVGNAAWEQETEKILATLTKRAEEFISPYQTISYEHKNSMVEISTLIRVGYIANDVEALTSSGYDLVVLGTKGVSGFDEIVFGSVAGNVAEVAKCPVLIIPQGASFEGINNLVYATDFDKKDTLVIDELLQFAESLHADKITCLHINTNPENIAENLTRLIHIEEQYWFTPIHKLQFELVSGESVLKTLYKYLEEQKPNIIAVLRKDRSFVENIFHQSISKKLAYHSKTPVLILK
jgi:nucleotide-binding universal stress UspA family protein